ncbi:MAG: GH36 C-terminal domain-containing protein, partial [Candidatus Latescibacteria bacterium]|nr:GH36 C-terminal domain-containing protein [Candidatus Latescibacterota bacterium]
PIRHILPQPRDPREWDAVEVYDERLREGMVFVFRPSSPIPETTIKLTGLDERVAYEIRSENCDSVIGTRTGRELMTSGFRVRSEETTGSEILCFRAHS